MIDMSPIKHTLQKTVVDELRKTLEKELLKKVSVKTWLNVRDVITFPSLRDILFNVPTILESTIKSYGK